MRRFSAILLIGAGLSASAAAEAPETVVTIKPVHALAAGVMAGLGTPKLLLSGPTSPHNYSLRQNDSRALSRAGIVVFVSEFLESFLVRALETLPSETRVVELSAADGLKPLAPRTGPLWDDEGGRQPPTSSGGHWPGVEDPDPDPHFWLDPINAKAIVLAIADELADADPKRSAAYGSNAKAVLARLDALDVELRDILAPSRNVPFLVGHDTFQYLERRYGLTALGAIVNKPDQRPNPRRTRLIRDLIQERNVVCVFGETRFGPTPLRPFVEGTKVKLVLLDAFGAGLPDTAEAYFTMMRGLATAMRNCLGTRP
jgi:zinc transport system substrate-binding protein